MHENILSMGGIGFPYYSSFPGIASHLRAYLPRAGCVVLGNALVVFILRHICLFFSEKKCLGPSAGLVNYSTDFNYFWLVEIRTAKGTVLLTVRQQLLLSFSCLTENNGCCIAVSQDCGHNNREWIKHVSISQSDPINSLSVDSYSGCFDARTIIVCLLFINNGLWTHMTPEIINRLCCRVAVVSTLLVRDASCGFDQLSTHRLTIDNFPAEIRYYTGASEYCGQLRSGLETLVRGV